MRPLRFLVALTCLVAVHAVPTSDLLGRGRGLLSDIGRRNYGLDGQRRGFGQSGYNREGSDRGREYGHDRQDFKAIVESHNSREQDRSYDRGYTDRGYQSAGYGDSGRSRYAQGYNAVGI